MLLKPTSPGQGWSVRLAALAAIALGSGVHAGYAQTTLLSGSVRAVSAGVGQAGVSGDPVSLWFSQLPVIAENEHTGERWETRTDGILNQPFASFTFAALPPGRYRLLVEGLDERWLGQSGGLRASETRVVLQEFQPIRVDIVLSPAPDDRLASAIPLRRHVRPFALADTCAGGPLNEPHGPERGELWGIVRTPGGEPASGVRLHLEAIGGQTRDPFQAVIRTTATGCYGLYGLWPGRYHVFVDDPPFAFDSEVEVFDVAAGATRRDIRLSAGRLEAGLPMLKAGWYSRLGLRDGGFDDVQRAVLEMEAELWQASRTRTIDAADMARVGGVVVWPYEPENGRRLYRMPGVRLVFQHKGSGEPTVTTTDTDGAYDLWLPQGRYTVRIEHPPFAPLVADVLVLPEGLVLREGVLLGTAHQSGVYSPQATRRSGLVADLNFALWLPVQEHAGVQTAVAGTSGVVTVRGSDFASSSSGPTDVTLVRRDLEGLPLVNGRTVQSALTLVPGVVVTESNGNLAQFTGLGQRRFSNRLTIDGIQADLAVDAAGPGIGQAGSGALPAVSTLGGTQVLVPLDAIEEWRVQTAGVSPERRQTPGVQTAIVTRAGSDDRTTSFFAQGRPDKLSARDFFENAGSRPRRTTDAWMAGASAGGPLVRGRLFGFAAWEGQWIRRVATTTIRAPTQAARDAATSLMTRSILDAYTLGDGRDVGSGIAEHTGAFPTGSWLSSFSVRADGIFSVRHRLFGRVQHGTSRGDEIVPGEDLLPRLTFAHTESTATTALTGGWSSVLSSWTHDLRVNVTRHGGRVDATPARDLGVAPLPVSFFLPDGIAERDASIRVALFPGAGGALFLGRTSDMGQRQVQFVDSAAWIRGDHQWHVGGQYQRVFASSTPPSYLLTYLFRGIADLQHSLVRTVTIDRWLPARTERQAWSVFAHDTWRISQRVSLALGVRYGVNPPPTSSNGTHPELVDYAALPFVVPRSSGVRLWNTSWRNLAPQIAASYEVRAAGYWATRVHGSWGVAFDDLTAPGLIPFGRGDGYVSSTFLGPAKFPLAAGSLDAAMPAPSFLNERYAIPPNLRTPRTYEWQVRVDQSLGRTQRLGVAYVGTAGRELIYWSAYDLDTHPIHAYSNDARSDYHALLVQYVKRLSGGLQGRLAYAWGHAIDTDSGEGLEPSPAPALVPLSLSRGSADFDRRHLLQVTASYQMPSSESSWLRKCVGQWQVAAVSTMQSGAPVTVTGPPGPFLFRPDLNLGVPTWIVDPTVASGRRLNPAAFSAPVAERHGTLGRNALRALPLRQLDVAVSRTVALGLVRLQLRIDAFNVLNIANFGPPEVQLGALGFGEPTRSYADTLGTGTLMHGGLTPVSQLGGPRAIQFGLRVEM